MNPEIKNLLNSLIDPTLYDINNLVQLINFHMEPKYHLQYDPMLGELTNPRTGKTMQVTPFEALMEIKYMLNH